MARATIPIVVTSPASGSVIANATVTVTRNADNSVPPVYVAATGATTTANNVLTTDANGRCTLTGAELYLEQGSYKFTISGTNLTTTTLIREIVSGDGITETTPIGASLIWHTNTAPPGYLLLRGQSIASASYPALAAALGVVGPTIVLPDMQQRFPLGKASAGTGATLGATGGQIDHAHTVTAHTHTIPAHTHGRGTLAVSTAATGILVNDPGHGHNLGQFNAGGAADLATAAGTLVAHGAGTGSGKAIAVSNSATFFIGLVAATNGVNGCGLSLTDNGHAHALTGTIGSGGGNGDASQTSGSTAPATDGQNPPFLVVNFIIRTGVQ